MSRLCVLSSLVQKGEVLRAVLPSDAAEDHAVQQRVSAEAVVAVHTAGNFARGVEPLDGPSRRVNNLGIPRLLI